MSSDGYPLRYRLLLMTDPTHPDDGHDGWATLGWDDDEEWDEKERVGLEHPDDDVKGAEPNAVIDAGDRDDLFGASRPLPADLDPARIELEKIPRRLWEQTLAPLHPQERTYVVRQVADERLRDHAHEVAFELLLAGTDRRNAKAKARHDAQRKGHPLPTPRADHATTRASVQINLRLRSDDHATLARAAAAVALKPTTLARALVLNGAAMILKERAQGQTHRGPPNGWVL